MKDLIAWCFDLLKAPFWVNLLAMLISAVMLLAYLFIGVAFLFSPLWIVGVVMIFAIPLYALIRAYENRPRTIRCVVIEIYPPVPYRPCMKD